VRLALVLSATRRAMAKILHAAGQLIARSLELFQAQHARPGRLAGRTRWALGTSGS